MADLETQVKSSADQLRDALGNVKLRSSGTALPIKCYENWEILASLHSCLTDAVPLFEVRRIAWLVMNSLVNDGRMDRENRRVLQKQLLDPSKSVPSYSFDGEPTDFAISRHLATTGYVCSAWSLYDRLANVCGRLSAWKDVPNDPWQDPKLWGNLMSEGNKSVGGFMIQQPLAAAYGWPTGVAYKIRNWLVHDGGDAGRPGFFEGTQVSDRFILHNNAVSYLQECCTYKCESGKIDRCCLSATDEPWLTRDLLQILEKYHAEIDTMLTYLVKWSVGSFVGQILTFCERDKHILVTTAVTTRSSRGRTRRRTSTTRPSMS